MDIDVGDRVTHALITFPVCLVISIDEGVAILAVEGSPDAQLSSPVELLRRV